MNFRIPVDLHDRYRQLVRDAEQEHPRLRHPSLTELVIALLEEGPAKADEVAEQPTGQTESQSEENRNQKQQNIGVSHWPAIVRIGDHGYVERKLIADQIQAGPSDAARVRDHKISGHGSNCRWSH